MTTITNPQEQTTDRSRWIALVVLCVGMLMIVLDATIVNVALPSIQDDLGFSQSNLAWIVNAYLIAFGGLLLLAGRLGDVFPAGTDLAVAASGLVLLTTALYAVTPWVSLGADEVTRRGVLVPGQASSFWAAEQSGPPEKLAKRARKTHARYARFTGAATGVNGSSPSSRCAAWRGTANRQRSAGPSATASARCRVTTRRRRSTRIGSSLGP